MSLMMSQNYVFNHSTPKSEARMTEIEELLDVSSSPFLLFLSARLIRSWQGVCRNLVF
jgi:hypothetical protein